MANSFWGRIWAGIRRLFGGGGPATDDHLAVQAAARAAAAAPVGEPAPSTPGAADPQPAPPPTPPAPAPPGAAPASAPTPPPSVDLTGSGEDLIFGIDFGTTYTSIAVVAGGNLTVLRDGTGQNQFPSVVCSPNPGIYLVGWDAREQSPNYPKSSFHSPKRLIGRRYDDRKVEPVVASMAVPMRAGPDGQILADVHGSPVAMTQICANILEHAAKLGRQACGVPVNRVVLSAPVEFKNERAAIKRAAELAGLEVIAVVDEPIAAAIGYGLGNKSGKVVVYDFGGGTFDCTLLEVQGGQFRILAKNGDAWLGGDDFDLAVAEHAARGFWRQSKVDLHTRQVEWQRLLDACERSKRALSEAQTTTLEVPQIINTADGPMDLRLPMDRALLNQLCTPLVQRSIECLEQCLKTAGVAASDVSHVAMTGGVSCMPLVRQQVEQYFGRKVDLAVDPQHAVVVGDSIYAHYLVAQGAKGKPA